MHPFAIDPTQIGALPSVLQEHPEVLHQHVAKGRLMQDRRPPEGTGEGGQGKERQGCVVTQSHSGSSGEGGRSRLKRHNQTPAHAEQLRGTFGFRPWQCTVSRGIGFQTPSFCLQESQVGLLGAARHNSAATAHGLLASTGAQATGEKYV